MEQIKPNCITCKTKENVVRIQYGRPAQQLMEEARQKKVYLGGCFRSKENWYCYGCNKQFYYAKK